MSIATRLGEIRERIEIACDRAGRSVESVRLVAVTKTRTPEEMAEAIAAGVTDLGENRVQEAEEKYPAFRSARTAGGASPRWHLVGHLQKNKARKALEIFDVIHSLDSVELGLRLDRLAQEMGKTQRVLVQVDLAGEATKHGLPVEELFPALERLASLHRLELLGLMILPPLASDPEEVRPFFRRLRGLAKEAHGRGLAVGDELSMGMSHDFEVAIEEGATLIRVGTALFGPREVASIAALEDLAP